MKLFAILVVSLVTAFAVQAGLPTWQELSSRLFTNTVFEWQAPTNQLPKSLWVYQRKLPQVFSASVISNAIIIGSLQSKGFPASSTNKFFIWEDKGPNYPGPISSIFGIIPDDANLYYSGPNYRMGSVADIPSDAWIAKQGWKYAAQLGVAATNLVQNSIYTHSCDESQGSEATSDACGRGVFLSRQLDGVTFFSADDDGAAAEGFSMEFGSRGQIRAFSLRWSKVEHYVSQQVVGSQEIIRCIKAHKTIVLPDMGDENYFEKLNKLANAKKLTITRMTPYYCEGAFGEVPTNDVPCKFITPVAELEAVADFGTNRMGIKILSPILTSEVTRLLNSSH